MAIPVLNHIYAMFMVPDNDGGRMPLQANSLDVVQDDTPHPSSSATFHQDHG